MASIGWTVCAIAAGGRGAFVSALPVLALVLSPAGQHGRGMVIPLRPGASLLVVAALSAALASCTGSSIPSTRPTLPVLATVAPTPTADPSWTQATVNECWLENQDLRLDWDHVNDPFDMPSRTGFISIVRGYLERIRHSTWVFHDISALPDLEPGLAAFDRPLTSDELAAAATVWAAAYPERPDTNPMTDWLWGPCVHREPLVPAGVVRTNSVTDGAHLVPAGQHRRWDAYRPLAAA